MEKEQLWIAESHVVPRAGETNEEDVGTLDPIPVESIGRGAPIATGPFDPVHKVDMLLLTSDASLRQRISASFAGQKRFNLRHLNGGIVEIEKMIGDGELPDVAVIDIGKGDVPEINALERLKKSRFLKVPIIAISGHIDPMIARGLMRIKVDDWLPADCELGEIQRACEKALHASPAEASSSHAQCTAFYPASGGCGNTTLAIQTAFLTGSRGKRPGAVCLVDLNFQDGTVADYLDLSPAFQLSELVKVSGRLDHQMLDVMLTRHRSGLAVLAAPRVLGRFVDVSGELIASVLGLLSESFEHLIIDLPKNWHPWTDNVVWGSDRIFVVTGFTIPALRQARFMTDAIAAKASPEAQVSVIVNRFHEPLMGPGLTRKDAEGILAARLGGLIPNVSGIVDDAINRGMPLSELRAGSKIEKKLLQILDRDNRISKE